LAVATPARPRANSSRIFIIAGAALAAVAFLLVIMLGGRGAGGVSGNTTKIVVAARDIPFRTALSKDDLTLASYPTSLVPTGSYASIADVIGKSAASGSDSFAGTNSTGAVAEVQIKQNQPVTSNLLARSVDAIQVQPAYLPIPKGFVSVTVPTGEQVGVAGYIQAGDYINIIASISTQAFQQGSGGGGQAKSVTKTVYTNVHVLKVGPATGTVSQGSAPQSATTGGVASSLTLVMTQCDAEMLKWLQGAAQLTYTLGSYQDYKPNDAKPDPSCADATAAHGVGPAAINTRWGFSSTN
jgi:Flp pilus assembly protein CpaB